MSTLTAFDIETGPLPDDQLPEFDRNSVKVGNTKDPEKIEAKIAEAEAEWREKLALSALTGRVLAIGYMPALPQAEPRILDGDETTLLNDFWEDYSAIPYKWVGFNSRTFDLPFLVRRSLINHVEVPNGVIDSRGYFHHSFYDLLDVWRCGDRSLWVKLNDLAEAFGIPGKLEGFEGADFAKYYFESCAGREKALEYLRQDVRVTLQLAIEMGL